ncbi:MAG: hypothetical protein DRO11_00795 [Methanobacteriota archaeon]|nr:MAG: hypothetical protein DRO11_00795 [Euryarchaeota archaeon]
MKNATKELLGEEVANFLRDFGKSVGPVIREAADEVWTDDMREELSEIIHEAGVPDALSKAIEPFKMKIKQSYKDAVKGKDLDIKVGNFMHEHGIGEKYAEAISPEAREDLHRRWGTKEGFEARKKLSETMHKAEPSWKGSKLYTAKVNYDGCTYMVRPAKTGLKMTLRGGRYGAEGTYDVSFRPMLAVVCNPGGRYPGRKGARGGNTYRLFATNDELREHIRGLGLPDWVEEALLAGIR